MPNDSTYEYKRQELLFALHCNGKSNFYQNILFGTMENLKEKWWEANDSSAILV
jgi:hypothetical protein